MTRARQPRAVRKEREWLTHYSGEIKGAKGNYDLPVRFDKTGGFVGIDQPHSNGEPFSGRVLLSPAQVKALIAFVSPLPAKKAKRAKPCRESSLREWGVHLVQRKAKPEPRR